VSSSLGPIWEPLRRLRVVLPAAFEPRVIVNLSLKALPQGYNFTPCPQQHSPICARPNNAHS
jgi:hypothetical protein